MPINVPCPQCGKFPPPSCDCPPLPERALPPAAPQVPATPKVRPEVIKLRREKRSGREVTVMEGFPRHIDLNELASALRAACGTGGTVKNGAIELQGDRRDAAAALLLERGFRSKRAGG